MFRNETNASKQKFYIYQQLKKMNLLTNKFKYGLYRNLNTSLDKIIA